MMHNLSAILHQHITANGAITIAEYMELALLHPEFGYYTSKEPFGVNGDFITAPEISQIFGELIGLYLADCWVQLGRPKAALVEIGPGRGTLMRDILRATRNIPGFHESISVHLVEASPRLKKVQEQVLVGCHSRESGNPIENTLLSGNHNVLDARLHGHDSFQIENPVCVWHEDITGLPPLPLLLVANEWLDALPIRQYIYSESNWYERRIGWDEEKGELCFVTQKVPLELLNEVLSHPLAVIPALCGDPAGMTKNTPIIETCAPAQTAITHFARHLKLHGGTALFIDYGYVNPLPLKGGGLGRGLKLGNGDTLQAVKSHQYHPVLQTPGTADITAHVDFGTLLSVAKKEGIAAYLTAQGAWLKSLGAELRALQLCKNASPMQKAAILSGVERLTSPTHMGELFKVLALSSLLAA